MQGGEWNGELVGCISTSEPSAVEIAGDLPMGVCGSKALISVNGGGMRCLLRMRRFLAAPSRTWECLDGILAVGAAKNTTELGCSSTPQEQTA